MRRLRAEDYAVDAVTGAKMLVGAWLCRRLDDGTVVRRRITETEVYCGFVTMSFIVYCVPTRTSSAPDEEWVESTICATTAIPRDKLTFLGGISMREGVDVFAVADADLGRFTPGSPWGLGNADNAINHYRRIMEWAHINVALPDDARILRCDGNLSYIISIVEANGNRYLFCEWI